MQNALPKVIFEQLEPKLEAIELFSDRIDAIEGTVDDKVSMVDHTLLWNRLMKLEEQQMAMTKDIVQRWNTQQVDSKQDLTSSVNDL